jgi:carbamoylphosphate synthase large subunit
MSRLHDLMTEFRHVKKMIRSTDSENTKNKLIGSLMSIKGQFKEANQTLIKRRLYAQNWRDKNRTEVSKYNREYARIRRKKIEDNKMHSV